VLDYLYLLTVLFTVASGVHYVYMASARAKLAHGGHS
jgi:hypothetical protein